MVYSLYIFPLEEVAYESSDENTKSGDTVDNF